MHYTTKFALGLVAAVGAWFGGRWVYAEINLRGENLEPVVPGEVNIIGMDTSKGYHVIVANRVAQLVLGKPSAFSAPDDPSRDEGEKRRIPIREMLQSLQGDEKALSRFVTVLNNMSYDDIPADPVVWKAEDLNKALDGDAALRKRLVDNLNVELDGTPLPVARPRALSEGIFIELPITIRIRNTGLSNKTKSGETILTARILEQFLPNFNRAVFSHYKEKEPTPAMIAGYYASEAKNLVDNPAMKQDIKKSIESRLKPARLDSFAHMPQDVLESIFVIVNDSHITDAKMHKVETATGRENFELELQVNDKGRNRLWKYSREKPGAQLLLISRGVAVAAPQIEGELSRSEVTITQLSDEGLAKNTVETLKRLLEVKKG